MRPLKPTAKIALRIAVCLGLIVAGIAGMLAMAAMKELPAEAEISEHPLQVTAVIVHPEDVPVIITGYGEAKPLNTVSIASQVAGKIVAVHSRLEPGEMVRQGEVLFCVDPADYVAARNEAAETLKRIEQRLLCLEKEFDSERQRLKIVQRNRELSLAAYERLRKLFFEKNVGSLSSVESAELAANTARELTDRTALAVETYPIRIDEEKHALAAAKSVMASAQTNLSRCEVCAPFDGRIKSTSLEASQYVRPGQDLITLADDAVLEIKVPLDSREVSRFLRFNAGSARRDLAWFADPEPVPCRVQWTEDDNAAGWEGIVHRIVEFDSGDRMATVAIRVDAANATAGDGQRLPLTEGMFCRVSIPGAILKNVMRLPRWTVSLDSTAYLVSDDRLKTVAVRVARRQNDEVLITQGLNPGDRVITTRLSNPLENVRVDIIAEPQIPAARNEKKGGWKYGP